MSSLSDVSNVVYSNVFQQLAHITYRHQKNKLLPVMRLLVVVVPLLLASIQTVKCEDSEDEGEDVRKGRQIMRKLSSSNLSLYYDRIFSM